MTATSITRIVVPSLALVGACAAALVFGVTHIRRAPPVETSAATAAPAQAEANAVAAELAVSPRTPTTDDSVPVFDIARIERTGDAVIAGRAAPGAIVELLRNGERLDGVVADQSGQFVMVPPRLPPGDYELTLRSRLPDGTLATSKQGVVVALDEVESNPGAVQSRPEVPFNVPETTITKGLWQDHAGRSSQARLLSQPPLHIAKRHDVAVSQLLHATAATPLSDGGASSAVLEPKIATTVVSRGDNLWRISRVTYGTGARYALVYKANRNRIHDPNRIYPGQIFFLPVKAR
jgi:nucleoid-associated protein YgaU